ncbi:hypothetical protein QZH41_012540 [Actinostola sp. cb2023]|nr:hypothetical protein QZH41_012540 [Actinostola sp. cb2023]
MVWFLKQFNGTQEFLRRGENSKKLINTASNLLDSINVQSWLQLQQDASTNPIRTLVKSLDEIGILVANAFNTSENETIVIKSKNLAMKTSKISPSIKLFKPASPLCVSWNPERHQDAWSDRGCHVITEETDAEKTTCACNHLTLFSFFMDPHQLPVLCKLTSILLHYFLLTTFTLMLCEGVLLYIVLVKVDMTGLTHKGRKPLYWFGWGFPLLLLAISLWATELRGYGNPPYLCWLSVKNGVVWAFVAPALVVIVVNLIVLVKIISRIKNSQRLRSYSQAEKIKTSARATIVTMPLLGVTWLFGVLTFHTDLKAFKYLFAICNSLQGVFIFIFHCLLDRQVIH